MTVHEDGWITLEAPEGIEGLHVRVRRDDAGRLVVAEMYMHGAELTATALREIRLARVEAMLATPIEVAKTPEGVFKVTGGNFDALAKAVSTIGAAKTTEPTLRDLRARATAKPTARPRRRWKLGRPDGVNPDAFYRRVADVYREAAETAAPGVAIADEAGVPVTTAHRWVREARRRGFLPPGRKGKRG